MTKSSEDNIYLHLPKATQIDLFFSHRVVFARAVNKFYNNITINNVVKAGIAVLQSIQPLSLIFDTFFKDGLPKTVANPKVHELSKQLKEPAKNYTSSAYSQILAENDPFTLLAEACKLDFITEDELQRWKKYTIIFSKQPDDENLKDFVEILPSFLHDAKNILG